MRGLATAGFNGKHSPIAERHFAGRPIIMHLHRRVLVIVKSGAAHTGIIKWKTERFDQVQHRAGIRAQANDVARVWRDFWFDQDDVNHVDFLPTLTRNYGWRSRHGSPKFDHAITSPDRLHASEHVGVHASRPGVVNGAGQFV